MRVVKRILVEMVDEATGVTSSVELADSKIKSTRGTETKVLEDKMAKIICEQLNAQMGMAFSKL
jgi:hypothetical protein